MPVTLVSSGWFSGFLRFMVRSSRAAIFEIQTALIKCTEKVEFADEMVHASAVTLTKSADYTLLAADSGKYLYVDTDAVVITLPSTIVGMSYTIVNIAVDGAAKVSVSPAAADSIIGNGFTAADNKDAINTKATAKRGDLLQIFGNGVTGWNVVRVHGTWAREA